MSLEQQRERKILQKLSMLSVIILTLEYQQQNIQVNLVLANDSWWSRLLYRTDFLKELENNRHLIKEFNEVKKKYKKMLL